jgi:enamine deaminase RidA (YjgF/YER057c/UK114 family)
MSRLVLLSSLAVASALLLWPADKKQKKEEETQTLELPKEPPAAVVAEARRLGFRVAPLSARGLLSQQVRNGLKWLLAESRGASIVKLRAFVAGSGDTRRVQAIVSEVFTERKLPLPALTVVQVGLLPLEGAQVELESVAVEKKAVNPNGLAFFSGQAVAVEQPLQPMLPLVQKSLARLRTALEAAGLQPGDVLRATCYLSSLDDLNAVRQRVYDEFPHGALDFVQRMREPLQSLAECEAVARLRQPPAQPLLLMDQPGLPGSPDHSEIALVGPRRLAITGAQLAFGFSDADARLAFQRLAKTLEGVGASYSGVAVLNVYPLSRSIAELVRKVRPEFFPRPRPPAGAMLPFEGLPSLDASFALEVIAVLPDSP